MGGLFDPWIYLRRHGVFRYGLAIFWIDFRPMDRFRRFDEAYYQRFYEDPKTRVTSSEDHAALSEFVFAFVKYNQLEVKSVLDVGAGVAHWKYWLEKHHPSVKYTGTEVSGAMCKKHGLQQKDIARWRDRKKHDLIVCQGVLQYLPDPDVAPAVANIAAMSKGLLYLEITTRQDLRENCDLRADRSGHIRPQRLLLPRHPQQAFQQCRRGAMVDQGTPGPILRTRDGTGYQVDGISFTRGPQCRS